jgi:hypothetical protein
MAIVTMIEPVTTAEHHPLDEQTQDTIIIAKVNDSMKNKKSSVQGCIYLF